MHNPFIFRFISCFFILSSFSLWGSKQAVTYSPSAGRFGDHLICYLHAKWISYHHQLPLLYVPFEHSSRLMLHSRETQLNREHKGKEVHLDRTPINLQSRQSLIYVCPYFPESQYELKQGAFYHFPVDWKDPKFRKIAREMISPTENLLLITPPKNTVNIAIHIREGGDVDPWNFPFRSAFPLKFPPMNFYTEGLSKVLSFFPDKLIHCHIFTDAKNPDTLIQPLRDASSKFQVEFSYRYNSELLEDFFSFFNFDVLIRPESNFSIIPHLIHDYAMVYYPVDCIIRNRVITINKTDLDINQILYEKLLLIE